jgi:rhamnosyltransferase
VKIAAVVVWYNPDKLNEYTAVQNILTYSNYLEKVYIVDNSNANNYKMSVNISNSIYIPNNDNFGIARGLNQGCTMAKEDGFEWVLTMDQDSRWDNDDIALYLSEAENIYIHNNRIVSFSPMLRGEKEVHSVLGDIRLLFFNQTNLKKIVLTSGYEFIDRTITSGNILSLQAWMQVGKFNELLFIDEVDYEFCYRIINNEYQIVKMLTCSMNHTIGEPKKFFFPQHFAFHHNERIYYIIRNMIYILTNFPEFAKKYKYKKNIRKIVIGRLIFLEFSDFRYAIKGLLYSKRNVYGRYNRPGYSI